MHAADISFDRAEFEAILDEIVLLLVVSFGDVGEPGSYKKPAYSPSRVKP